MELLLRLMQPRWMAAIAAALALAFGLDRWRGALVRRAELALHPPAPAAAKSPLAVALESDNDRRESVKLRALHRAVSAEIQERRGAPGFDADAMQAAADAALKLDKDRYRVAGVERLNRIRMAVPLPKEQFRPAAANDAVKTSLPPSAVDTPEPKAVAGQPIGRYPKKARRR